MYFIKLSFSLSRIFSHSAFCLNTAAKIHDRDSQECKIKGKVKKKLFNFYCPLIRTAQPKKKIMK